MDQTEWIKLMLQAGFLEEGKEWRIFSESSLKNDTVVFEGIGIASISSRAMGRRLFEKLGEEFASASDVLMVKKDGSKVQVPLKELMDAMGDDPVLVAWYPDRMIRKRKKLASMDDFLNTMRALREEGGCPWDRMQNHATLRTFFIQEVYEVIDAIDNGDYENLKEELGDVLYQIAFHARIEEEKGKFTFQDVVDGINNKMRRRHPFVFKKKEPKAGKTVEESWENRKKFEKNRKYLLDGVPKSLPSLLLACIIQKKVSSTTVKLPMESCFSVDETWRNTIKVVETGDRTEKEEKCGAFLFELVRVLREAGIDPELSLHRFCIGYMRKFNTLEDTLR